MIKIVVLNC